MLLFLFLLFWFTLFNYVALQIFLCNENFFSIRTGGAITFDWFKNCKYISLDWWWFVVVCRYCCRWRCGGIVVKITKIIQTNERQQQQQNKSRIGLCMNLDVKRYGVLNSATKKNKMKYKKTLLMDKKHML